MEVEVRHLVVEVDEEKLSQPLRAIREQKERQQDQIVQIDQIEV
jgi:hypothetical protein